MFRSQQGHLGYITFATQAQRGIQRCSMAALQHISLHSRDISKRYMFPAMLDGCAPTSFVIQQGHLEVLLCLCGFGAEKNLAMLA